MKAERSKEAKQANRNIIHFGLADLGFLLTHQAPGELGRDDTNIYVRSYERAIGALGNLIGKNELALTLEEDMDTYSTIKGPYDLVRIKKASPTRSVEAGEMLVFDTERRVREYSRRFYREYLPDSEHYLPFSSEDKRMLLLSADDIATSYYLEKAELFVPRDASPQPLLG